MKVTTYILTIYMLILSLAPCGDGGSGIMEVANHFFGLEYQHVSDYKQHSNDCGDDTCSPFCICSCCSISVNVPTTTILVGTPIFNISDRLPFYNSGFYPTGFPFSVWHPPTFS